MSWGGRISAGLTAGVVSFVACAPPAAAAPADGCALAPDPDRPGSGLVGLLDPTPGVGHADTVYGEVGYAGLTWHTYDLCGRPDATVAGTDTWAGGIVFDLAKTLVAAADGLHAQLGVEQLGTLDGVLHQGVGAMYRCVFTPWVGPALLVLAVVLLWLAARGDLAQQAYRGAVAIGALAVGAAVYAAPVSLLSAADDVLFDGVAQMQHSFLADLGAPDAATGGGLPETLTEHVVYENWLRGEFGSADAPQARELGRALLRSQTFTRAEIAGGGDTPEAATRKRREFTGLAARMGDRAGHFQGTAGGRIGAAAAALLQAVAFAAFPAAAALVVFVAVLVLRLLVVFAPLLAVVAIVRPAFPRTLFRLVAAVLTCAVLAGGLAAVHAWLVLVMVRPGSGVAPTLALVVAGAVSALCWVLVRPVRRLATLGAMALPYRAGSTAPRQPPEPHEPLPGDHPRSRAAPGRPARYGRAPVEPDHPRPARYGRAPVEPDHPRPGPTSEQRKDDDLLSDRPDAVDEPRTLDAPVPAPGGGGNRHRDCAARGRDRPDRSAPEPIGVGGHAD